MKTSELTGAALDWAVAKCEGLGEFWLQPEEFNPQYESMEYHYSTDWAQGGPIIQRERIRLDPRGVWVAGHDSSNDEYLGATPLIAAMRCYVASKLGEEVGIPKEMTNE